MIANYLSFAILAGILVLIPGLDFAVVLRYASTQSRRQAFLVSFGITAGLYVWGVAAVFGIAAILSSSAHAFNVLRLVGAMYLFWIGSKFLIASFKGKRDIPSVQEKTNQKPFVRGLMTNLLNPKPAMFYLSIFPQFIPVDSNHLVTGLFLVSIHAIETMVFFAALIYFVGTLKTFFSRPSVVSYMERISGILIICFGVKLLFEKAPH